jgi:hypothetical protein
MSSGTSRPPSFWILSSTSNFVSVQRIADSSHVEWNQQAAVFLDPEQHIEEVFLLVADADSSPLLVLLDGAVHESGHLAVTYVVARRALTFMGLAGLRPPWRHSTPP